MNDRTGDLAFEDFALAYPGRMYRVTALQEWRDCRVRRVNYFDTEDEANDARIEFEKKGCTEIRVDTYDFVHSEGAKA